LNEDFKPNYIDFTGSRLLQKNWLKKFNDELPKDEYKDDTLQLPMKLDIMKTICLSNYLSTIIDMDRNINTENQISFEEYPDSATGLQQK
jgi:hypothetical protein